MPTIIKFVRARIYPGMTITYRSEANETVVNKARGLASTRIGSASKALVTKTSTNQLSSISWKPNGHQSAAYLVDEWSIDHF